jgi:hypothetical protein
MQLSCATSTINVASLFIACTKGKQYAVIKFLWAEGIRGVEIQCKLFAEYGDRCFVTVKYVQAD